MNNTFSKNGSFAILFFYNTIFILEVFEPIYIKRGKETYFRKIFILVQLKILKWRPL